MRKNFVGIILPAFVLAGAVAGCRRESVRVYDAPKERAAQPSQADPHAHAPQVQLPEGWMELPGDQMSLAKYLVRGSGGAEARISVSLLPPSGEAANLTRWRRQVGLEPATADDLAKQRESAKIGGHDATLFDILGAAPDTQKKTRIVAALATLGGEMWVFKMMGDDELVAAQKPVFQKFISNYPLPGHDHQAEQAAAVPPAPASSGAWPAPASWKEQPPGPMQDAKFSVADGRASVTVSGFAGRAGAMRANVDRWRGQIGLGPATDDEFAKAATLLDLGGAQATLVDMAGLKQRLVAAIVTRGEKTWYFKLLGESPAVEKEKKAFLEFVKAAK